MDHYDTVIIHDDDINVVGPNEDGEPELTFRCSKGGRLSLVMSEERLRRCRDAIAGYLRRTSADVPRTPVDKAWIDGLLSDMRQEWCKIIEQGDDPDTAA